MCVTETISFLVPLPPSALRPNRRAPHWATRRKAADEYSEDVWCDAHVSGAVCDRWSLKMPWLRARVTYTWRYAGVAPDIDNIAGALKALQDCLCVAPVKASKDRWYLGLVENDQGIEATFKREKVARKADEGVYVEIERA